MDVIILTWQVNRLSVREVKRLMQVTMIAKCFSKVTMIAKCFSKATASSMSAKVSAEVPR